MSSLLIRNGSVLHVEEREMRREDLLLRDGKIASISPAPSHLSGDEVIEAEGLLVSPGFIDLHVHLREPGFEQKEEIATGTLAAARGGFTTVAAMPNTRPILDSVEELEWLQKKIAREGVVRVLPIAAITKGELGRELTEMERLKEAGAFAFSDDGVGVQDARLMREAFLRAASLRMPILAHCEENALAKGGVVHEGEVSRRLGLPGIPGEAEAVQVARDLVLAEATGVHYHVCHVSSRYSVLQIRAAKERGVSVTAEVTPHHLLLDETSISDADARFKMNPPLRSVEDRRALIEALRDGTIDFIATDHAPHTEEEKGRGMILSPFGIVGLETAFPLLYTHLVEKGIFTLYELVERMTLKPARFFHLPYGEIREGATADLTLIDLAKEREIDPKRFASKGKNTPFAGWRVKGWPVITLVEGRIVWKETESER
ncbi:dihydroorotase [Thermicanus aegyptius]|uniref:dihydroorotase n=1 Tax=Thermicanus aegyptius TaxID=94009 RepID=UPI0003FB22AA|nr:dihydroorotase [Thermicanus aegyptius]